MCEPKLLRVQTQAWRERLDICGCIEVVAKNRMSDCQEMHAKLVTATGDRRELKARACWIAESFKNAPPCDACATVHEVNNLQRAIDKILANRQVDLAALLGRMTSGNCNVSL